MLTRLHIDNFRCFVNFDYRPERKQLLLGANGTGKSSLLDAIHNLKQFIRGEENPFSQSTRTRWLDQPLQVLELGALLDDRLVAQVAEIKAAVPQVRPSVGLTWVTVPWAKLIWA